MTGHSSSDVTGGVARFVSETRFEDLDTTTVEQLKRLILDGVANAVGGLRTSASRIQRVVVADLGSGQVARVLGSGERASLLTAAYTNAASANALDFDDTYKTFLHPGATAVAPSLAVGEKLSAHGRDVIAAVAVGYEVPIRVAEAAFPSPERLRQVWGFAPLADPGRGRSDGGPATARHRDHPSRRCRLQRSRPERPQDRELASNFTDQAPEDIVDAQFSLPYLLALELAERSPARGLSESDLTDPTVLDVAARVTVHHEAEMDAPFHSGHMPSRVVVHRRTGGVVEAAVSDPVWGGPGDPFTDDDLIAKCSALIEPAWGPGPTRKLIEGILHLDEVSDLAAVLPG